MTFIETVDILNKISPIILFSGLVISICFYKNIDSLHKSIAIFLLLMFTVDISARILREIYGNNQIILPLYSLIELVFFLYFYKKHLFTASQKIVTILGVAGIIYITGEILWYFILNKVNPKEFQPYAKVVDNFIVIVMALAFFQEKISSYTESKWENFRLNVAILAFFTINLLFFLPFNFLVNETSGLKFYFWLFNLVITVLFYLYLISLIWQNAAASRKLKNKAA